MKSDFLIIFSLSILKVDVDFFLFKMFFKRFISKLFSSDSFLAINLKDYIIIINEVIDKKERSFDVNILLLSYLYRSKMNNILFLSILKKILYLFIYNFFKIKSCYLN